MARLIRFCFYLLFLITPLVLCPWNFELFEFPKMMFVYALTVIIAGSWLIHSIINRKFTFRRTPLDIPLLIFLASQILSTVFSINVHTSLIGYYSRFHGGLLSTLSYLILYYAFVTFMGQNDKEQKNPVHTCLRLLLTSTAIVATYAIAEHFGIDKHLWVQDVQNRVFSTLGQPNWLAAFLVMVIPLIFALNFSSSSPIYYILHTTYFFALLFTKSRSGIIGFVLMYSIFWLLVLLKNKLSSFPWKQFLLVSCILFLVAFVDGLRWIEPVNQLNQRLSPQSSNQLSPKTSPLPSGTQLESGGTESGSIRKIVWRGAIAIWQHYPVFGSGVETFAYSYYNFRPVEHNLVSEWDFLYNKAHNEYLNFLAATGAFGLGAYLLLQIWIVIWLLKSLHTKYYLLNTAFLSAYIGVSISNFFGFSTVPIALLMFLYPAMAVVLTDKSTSYKLQPACRQGRATSLTVRQAGYKLNISLKFLIATLLLVSCYLLLRLGVWWHADTLFASGKRYLEAGYPIQAFPRLEQAVALLPNEPNYHSEFSAAAADVALELAGQNATQSANQAVDLALSESNLTQRLNPVHLNFLKTRVRVMLTLSQLNPAFLTDTLTTLLKGLELSPTDAKLTYHLGLVYLQLNDITNAIKALEQTVVLKSNYETARFALGSLYQEQKEYSKAREQYEYILKYISPENSKVKESLDKLPR